MCWWRFGKCGWHFPLRFGERNYCIFYPNVPKRSFQGLIFNEPSLAYVMVWHRIGANARTKEDIRPVQWRYVVSLGHNELMYFGWPFCTLHPSHTLNADIVLLSYFYGAIIRPQSWFKCRLNKHRQFTFLSCSQHLISLHDDVIKRKRFLHYWPFCERNSLIFDGLPHNGPTDL